jgi:hypothetical protein
MDICLQSNVDKNGSNDHTFLVTRGIPFCPWLNVLHKQVNIQQIVHETLFNQQLNCGENVMKTSLKILKQMFKKLMLKTSLNILFLPNVVICSCEWQGWKYKNFYGPIEVDNNQQNGRIRDEPWTSIDVEVEQVPLKWLKLHKELRWNNIFKIVGFKFKGLE